jgi:pyruvate-formate lyase-activating enzyme
MTYCPLPFRHVFIEPRGVRPCCSFIETHDLSVDQWLESDRLEQLQHNISQGKIDPGCRDCIHTESITGSSTRLAALKDYDNETFHATDIDYVDYRASNVCNFRCRSCEPYFSNGIAQDVRRSAFLQTIHQIPSEKIASVNDCQWIIKNLKNIRRLMLTGGEPTIMPGVREILQEVRAQETNTQIIMITNGSFQDRYWLDRAQDMPSLNFTVSIDAVGTAAEIIRHGSRWSVIESNIRYLAQHGHSLNFSTVITRLNLFHLAPLLRFARSIRRDYDRPNGRTQFIQICKHPRFLDPVNLPDDLRPVAMDYIASILDWEDHAPTREVLQGLLTAIKTHVYNAEQWLTGQRYNQELDAIRQENHSWLYEPSW